MLGGIATGEPLMTFAGVVFYENKKFQLRHLKFNLVKIYKND